MDWSALIKSYCRGDEAAFRLFFDQQAPRLWRFLVAKGVAPDSANDVVAEAFARFVERACKDPSAPVAFLYRIALNLRIDEFRRDRREQRIAETLSLVCEGTREDPGSRLEVHDLLARLDGHEQNLMLLRYWIGLTHREIAEVLGLPEGTVRRQSAAALKQLKNLIERNSCPETTTSES